MPRLILPATFVIVASLALGGCASDQSSSDPSDVTARAERADSALVIFQDTQTKQECPDVPQDEAAKSLIRSAQESGSREHIYGEDDPYDRVDHVLKHLWSRPNPAGEGIIVTAVRDVERDGLDQVSRARHRAIWLVLDGTAYPLNVEASGAHGLLASGLPADVAQRSGIPEHAVDTEKALGIDDYILFRWDGPEDPLPKCG